MHSATVLVLLIAVVPCLCQRSPYAGLKAIGYPDIKTNSNDNQFTGELPARLNGDVEYAKRLEQLPPEQQPFWMLNQEHYKEQMNNPQTYPLRTSGYNEYAG